jgi:hypothetical protein
VCLRLPTTPTNIHPPLRLPLHFSYNLINQFRRPPVLAMLPNHLIPRLQQQFIHIQLDGPRLNTLFHHTFRKVVCAVQRDYDASGDLGVDGLEAVEVQLTGRGAGGPVVAVDVADGRSEDVDVCCEEVVYVLF